MIESGKKKVLLEIFLKLSQKWDLAKGLYVLAEGDFIDDKSLEGIIMIIESALKNVNDINQIKAINNSLNNLKKIKELEKKDLKNQNLDLENILNEINNI